MDPVAMDGEGPSMQHSQLDYFTFNPGCLDDKEKFSYRQLQQLSVQLGLNGKGKREELVLRLQQWHRSQSEQTCWGPGSFHAVKVNVCSPGGRRVNVSPRLLSPLLRNPRRHPDGNPIGQSTA